MPKYYGPAARKLVGGEQVRDFPGDGDGCSDYRDPRLNIEWNQIHLCELNAEVLEGFGKEFEAALREDLPEGTEFSDAFADLGRMRTVPRWTLNDGARAGLEIGTVSLLDDEAQLVLATHVDLAVDQTLLALVWREEEVDLVVIAVANGDHCPLGDAHAR